jgi:hypothetical protein
MRNTTILKPMSGVTTGTAIQVWDWLEEGFVGENGIILIALNSRVKRIF